MGVPGTIESGIRPGTDVGGIDDSGNVFCTGGVRIGGALTVTGGLTVAGQPVTPGGGGSSAPAIYPASGYGMIAQSGDPIDFDGSSTFTDGILFVTRLFVPANNAIGSVWAGVATSATGAPSNANGVIIWADDGTFVQSKQDSAMWAAAPGWTSTTLTTPIPLSTSDRFVRVGLLLGGWSSCQLFFTNRNNASAAIINGGAAATQRRCVFASSIAAFPGTITPASFGSVTAFVPLVGLAAV